MLKKSNLLFLLIVACVLSIFVESCDSSRSGGVLSSKKMENLLVDMHVLEGSLRATGNYYDSGEESLQYYATLFDKYGITQADFDSSLVWYTKHPKKFERIYQNVVARVDSLSNDIRKGKYHPVDSAALTGETNLWTLATKYVLTKDSARRQLDFKIENVELQPNDFYKLSFLHRVAPTDSSLNPHAVLYVNYTGDVVDSIYTRTLNDSVLRRYTLIFKARKSLKIKSLSGFILGNDSSIGKMSATIDSIKLIRKFNPFKQDSIRAAILKNDTIAISKEDSTAVSKNDTITVSKDDSTAVSKDSVKVSPKFKRKLLELKNENVQE